MRKGLVHEDGLLAPDEALRQAVQDLHDMGHQQESITLSKMISNGTELLMSIVLYRSRADGFPGYLSSDPREFGVSSYFEAKSKITQADNHRRRLEDALSKTKEIISDLELIYQEAYAGAYKHTFYDPEPRKDAVTPDDILTCRKFARESTQDLLSMLAELIECEPKIGRPKTHEAAERDKLLRYIYFVYDALIPTKPDDACASQAFRRIARAVYERAVGFEVDSLEKRDIKRALKA